MARLMDGSRQEFDAAVRDWIVKQNREGYGAADWPGGLHGPASCTGHPQAIFKAHFDYNEWLDLGELPPCGFSEGRSGSLDRFPAWAPWHGPSSWLRLAYDPEELDEFADRWVATDGLDPRNQPLMRTAGIFPILPQSSPTQTYAPLVLPDVRPRGVGRWLEPLPFYGGESPRAWKARQDCCLIVDFALTGPEQPFLVVPDLDKAHNRMTGSTAKGRHVLRLATGDCFFIGSVRSNAGVIEGHISVDVGPLDMATTSLEDRVNLWRRDVLFHDAFDALYRSEANRLDPLTGPLPHAARAAFGFEGGVREAEYAKVDYGNGDTVTALPQEIVREMLAVSQLDKEEYRENETNCVYFSLKLRNELLERYGVNVVHVVSDTKSNHAYVAFLCYHNKGDLFWWFVEPQTDQEVALGSFQYLVQHGFIWLATSIDNRIPPEQKEAGTKVDPSLVPVRSQPPSPRFVWIAHGDKVIKADGQFVGEDVFHGTARDLGLTDKPLPVGSIVAAVNDWGICYILPDKN